jgi:hypothetical protein
MKITEKLDLDELREVLDRENVTMTTAQADRLRELLCSSWDGKYYGLQVSDVRDHEWSTLVRAALA